MADFIGNRRRYKRRRFRGPDGVVRFSAGVNDAVSRATFAMTKEQLVTVLEDNALGDRFLVHARKNIGHFKMILCSALRDRIKKGQTVVIGPHVIRTLDQEVGLPEGFVECPASMLPKAVRTKDTPRRKHRRKVLVNT